MKVLLTALFLGVLLGANAQTYMYIETGTITPESPVSTSDEVSIRLTGNFSDTGAGVDDYDISLDGSTVSLVINASSDGGGAVLVPFDITYELGMYAVGTYEVEISGTGIGVSIEGPLEFEVIGETGGFPEPAKIIDFEMYPNPTSDFVTVSFENWTNDMQVEVLSIDSKIIMKQFINSKTTVLNTSNLESGIYMVRILDANGKIAETAKVVVEH